MTSLVSLRDKIETAWRLGPRNVVRVLIYRFALRCGWYTRFGSSAELPKGCFFAAGSTPTEPDIGPASRRHLLERAEAALNGRLALFSSVMADTGAPPNWNRNAISGATIDGRRHWSAIGDFEAGAGDIKAVWEVSRFSWAPLLAQAYCATTDSRFLISLETWAADWVLGNPPYSGPNWKCGQETSLRLLNFLLAQKLLGGLGLLSDGALAFVRIHVERILLTLSYAQAQDNNHGTSEAAAIYVGGGVLERFGRDEAERRCGERWRSESVRRLTERAFHLITDDGGFSQYSVNYHRLALDTFSLVSLWRRWLDLPELPRPYVIRAQRACEWLRAMVASENGDAPNLGANDGALLIDLCVSDYRDHRPSVQLAAVLFHDARAYGPGIWDEALAWLDLQVPEHLLDSPGSEHFADSGFVVLRPKGGSLWAVLRTPRCRFRPGQADALHLDLWQDGENLLRDAGSYSYNCTEPWQSYFSSTAAHNTVQFDSRDQMPRLARFLFGSWIDCRMTDPLRCAGEGMCVAVEYRDRWGVWHRRTVHAALQDIRITDEWSGHKECAVLRWRLKPGDWIVDGLVCRGNAATLDLETSTAPRRISIVDGWESRYYQKKAPLPVLEVEFGPGSARVSTIVRVP